MKDTLANPLIVQSDRSILLETDGPLFEDARDAVASLAELVKSPEHIHTYRITPLSLWNAAAAGMTADQVIDNLVNFSKYEVPDNIIVEIRDYISRYGRLKLHKLEECQLVIDSDDARLTTERITNQSIHPLLTPLKNGKQILIEPGDRGNIKSALIKLGFPVEDLAGYVVGAPLEFSLREVALSGDPFALRKYQRESVDAFYMRGSNHGGSGIIVLPCGAGKTCVGIGVIHALQTHCLVLTTNTIALRQWKSELLDKTTLTAEQIGEYSGDSKEIRPVTLASYQVLTYRRTKDSTFLHFDLFHKANWGLIIYY